MVFVFNLYAIAQLLIIGLVVGLLHLILSPFGYDMIGGSREMYVSLIFAMTVSVYSDVKGLKGKLFYIPVWAFCGILAVVAFVMAPTFFESHSIFEYVFLWFAIIGNCIWFYKLNRLEYQKIWTQKQQALQILKETSQSENLDQKKFWILASHIYYRPGYLFFLMYPIWSKLHEGVISQKEFIQYYRDFADLIKPEYLVTERLQKRVADFKEDLAQAGNDDDLLVPDLSLSRLGNAIDEINTKNADSN